MPMVNFTVVVEKRKEVPVLHNQVKAVFTEDKYSDLEDSYGSTFPIKFKWASRIFKTHTEFDFSDINGVELCFYIKSNPPVHLLQELLEWLAKDVTVIGAEAVLRHFEDGNESWTKYELGADNMLHLSREGV